MAGTRKYNLVDEDTTKVTIIVPKDIDRQLRMLAARRGQPVGPIVRGWITEKLLEVESSSSRVQVGHSATLRRGEG